jgi:Cytochrome P460
MSKLPIVVLLVWAIVGMVKWTVEAQAPQPDGPTYTGDGRLIRPLDYREWVYVTSGLGMTYGPAQQAGNRSPLFDNVFVNRTSYREFLRSGTWPDKTMFVLEIRRADENVSINNGGRTQGAMTAMEAAVKDLARFPDGGWGYFTFDGPNGLVDAAGPLPATASCYSCRPTAPKHFRHVRHPRHLLGTLRTPNVRRYLTLPGGAVSGSGLFGAARRIGGTGASRRPCI